MKKVKDIYDFIDSAAPFRTQCDWDNSGLCVGGMDNDVDTVLVCLDVTFDTLEAAKAAGAQLVVSHHPLIFRPKKAILDGSLLCACVRSGISFIGAHTCYDTADGGVNDVLADLLELKDIKKIPTPDCAEPLLRMGTVDPVGEEEFAAFAAKKLSTTVRLTAVGKTIRTVMVAGGATDHFYTAKIFGADCLVTGDAKHHELLDSQDDGLTVVAAGHYETEEPSMRVMRDRLAEAFPDLKVVYSSGVNPVRFVSAGD